MKARTKRTAQPSYTANDVLVPQHRSDPLPGDVRFWQIQDDRVDMEQLLLLQESTTTLPSQS